MAVGIGMIGREITMTVGGGTLLGVVEKSITMTNEVLETTDDASSGWQEYLAKVGKKGIALSVSGTLKNLELFDTYFQTSQIVACVITYPEGSSVSFDAVIENVENGMPGNELSTYSMSLQSSGSVTWSAGE